MNAIAHELYTEPTFSTAVYAVYGASSRRFLGYEDDAATLDAMMQLGDHVKIERELQVEAPILDEWLTPDVEVADYGSVTYEAAGTSKYEVPLYLRRRADVVDEDGNKIDEITCLLRQEREPNEKALAEREAWDDVEFAKLNPTAFDDRFEFRGEDARSSFTDATEKQRRQRADHETQRLLERQATVNGDERFLSNLVARKKFRAYVEAFGQDPDDEAIQAWRKAHTYQECVRVLIDRAEREGVELPVQIPA